MTTQTDLKPLLAAHYAALAGATMACPEQSKEHPTYWRECPCRGSGEVAAFEGFRQVCKECKGEGGWGSGQFHSDGSSADEMCTDCNGLGWHVCAVGSFDAMAAAESGLTTEEFCKIESMRFGWAAQFGWRDPMPDADAILLKALELVCRIKELEVD
ncbi:hypothetical protein LCGC14_0457850 [marine sediment metagenome]|uniref:Uncharacterized protein n=1 Tax=marine sediment metagenome TaxID=412755 RepID=A0A0F9SYN0_9ZZZZ